MSWHPRPQPSPPRRLSVGVRLGLIAAMLVLAGAAVGSYVNAYRLLAASREVARSNRLREEIALALSAMQDAETGQRGYLLTGDSRYLRPYVAARASWPHRLERLRTLTAGRPAQQQRLVELELAATAKLREMRETIRLRRRGDTRTALSLVRSGYGEDKMDAVRTLLASLDRSEKELLGQRTVVARAMAWISAIAFSVAAMVALALLAALAYLFRAQLSAREKADREARQHGEAIETINRAGQSLSAELQLDKLLQALIDAATTLTGAGFGAFFLSQRDEAGESYLLYTLAGAPREAFSKFPALRDTAIFRPTFGGEGPVRMDDVRRDPRYGKNAPFQGIAPGHLPVVSYLAVPVVSRSGVVLGGLFFGHPEAAVFGDREEQIVVGLAAQAAIAIDNAHLYESERRARAEAEAASRAKDEFLSTVSHELRTPLAAMLGWVRVLRSTKIDDARAEKAMDIIERSGRTQARLIDDLIDVSRIVTGRLRLDIRRVPLAGVVGAALDTVRPLAEAKGVRLEATITAVDPVAGDGTRLEQVAWNLLSNAVKFTPPGGRIEVCLSDDDGQARFAVRDTGSGIAPEFLPHVFDPFRQGEPVRSRQGGGLGLGLAIVRALVEQHGGAVRAESAGEGRGALFVVTLPFAPAAIAIPQPDEDGRPTRDLRLDGRTVLVVDDDREASELLRVILEERGATVAVAGSAHEAIALLERSCPDVLVSDIRMPGEDGYALVRTLRASERLRDLPAVAITAFAAEEDRGRALAAGYHAHLAKPVETDGLVAAIAALVGNAEKA